MLTLRTRKLRLRGVELLDQGHTAIALLTASVIGRFNKKIQQICIMQHLACGSFLE